MTSHRWTFVEIRMAMDVWDRLIATAPKAKEEYVSAN